MKIGSELRSNVETNQRRPQVEDRKTFDRLLTSEAQKVKEAGLERQIAEIEKQGDKLIRYRTFRELAKFKRMVKDFLQETVAKGLDLKKAASFSFDGSHRTLTTVEEIDEKLIELTEQVMDEERRTVDLLGVVGEIKGMLVNIYM